MYLTNSSDLRSAKTKIGRLETNLVSSSKHAHDSSHPINIHLLIGICLVSVRAMCRGHWEKRRRRCVSVSGFLGMSHGDFKLVGITVGFKRGDGEWTLFIVVDDGGEEIDHTWLCSCWQLLSPPTGTCWKRADAPHSKNESSSYSHQTTSGQILPFNCRLIHHILIRQILAILF